MKIKKGDTIQILQGKDKGKKGKVIQVLLSDNKVVVEGLNLLIKHVRPKKQGEKGQRVQFPAPLPESRAALVCPKCSKAIRVGYKIMENNKKLRYCKKCQGTFD